MMYGFDEAVTALCKIADKEPIDWEAFDAVLLATDDINQCDKQTEETILSEFMSDVDTYYGGQKIVDAIPHFLAHGYDVKANGGRNGGFALSSLCWASYDRYVLDAAKLLMDTGAPLDYSSDDDECGVFGSIEWRVSGAWGPDCNYDTANIFEAYYAVANAYKDGKDYHSICSFWDCIGERLTAVSTVKSEDNRGFEQEKAIRVFPEALILWFDERPLVISRYVDMVVNPLYVEEHKASLVNIDREMQPLLGATLTSVRYLDAITGYLEFDNGMILCFSNRNEGDDTRVGICTVCPTKEFVEWNDIDIECVCFPNGYSYAQAVTEYDHEAVAVFDKENGYLVTRASQENGKPFLKVIPFERDMLCHYGQQLAVAKPQEVICYCDNDQIHAVQMVCDGEYLNLCATEYDIEITLSDEQYLPYGEYDLRDKPGKHIRFIQRES